MENSPVLPGYKLPVMTAKGRCLFSPLQIIRLEAKSNYTNIYFSDHKPLMIAKVLKDLAIQLEPFGFIRVHRSHLVNKKHIVSVDNSGNLVMNDLSTAEISRRKKKNVMFSLNIRPEVN